MTPRQELLHWREVLATTPGDYDAMYDLAVVLRKLRRALEAVPLLQAVIAAQPAALDAHLVLANAYTNLKQYELAKREFKAVLNVDPQNVSALNNYGRMLRLADRYAEAEAVVREGLTIAPDDADLHRNLAATLYCLFRDNEAAAEYRTAGLLRVGDAQTRIHAGDILAELNEWQDAKQEYEHALVCKPNDKTIKRKIRRAASRARRDDRRRQKPAAR